MPITLRVVDSDTPNVDANSVSQFAGSSITIGRYPDCDCVVRDSERLISARHCVIEEQDGIYWLTDTSQFGTYINKRMDAMEPTVYRNRVELKNGDFIDLAAFRVRVEFGSVKES